MTRSLDDRYPQRREPCVDCGLTPTVAYMHGETQRLHGRLCAEHAERHRLDGVPIAGDTGGVRNWPSHEQTPGGGQPPAHEPENTQQPSRA